MQNLKLNSDIKEKENMCKTCDNLSVKNATASSDKSRNETGKGKCNDESKDEIFIEESEGELDMTSSFVSKAASIAKRKLELQELKHKTEKKKNYINNTIQEVEVKQSSQEISGDMGPDVISRSLELANIGNQLANTGRFDLAIKYFTDAIKLNPKEFKFFGNRSFCYERLQQYDRALSDAEICISICPSWTKGSFRKGRALLGLKRLAEAAIAFKEVLKLDSISQDAAEELMNVQIFQLMEMGFSREQSANALIIHGTVQKALEALSTLSDAGIMRKDNCVRNDCSGATEEQWISAKRKTPVVLKSASCNLQMSSSLLKTALKPKVDSASSPQAQKPCLELFPVWVGNVTNYISEIVLRKVFSSVGEIHSIRMLPSRRCAFVNYKESKAAELAIKTLQGLEIYDAKLLLRPPDHSYKNLGGANISTVIPKVSDPTTVSVSQKSVRADPISLMSNVSMREKSLHKIIPDPRGGKK
uniref:Uncharacterized LOC114652742 n=1 Tax=Erpetoichthys calabaricus TaxID=27687 RepID=A0A8C4S5Z9_ERPCA